MSHDPGHTTRFKWMGENWVHRATRRCLKSAVLSASLVLLAAIGWSNPGAQAQVMDGASAVGDRSGSPTHTEMSDRPRRAPMGVSGDGVFGAQDWVHVVVPIGTSSLSQCRSGQFCIWSSTSYTGSFMYEEGQDVTRTIAGSVGSLYNNRVKGARLYSNTGSASICFARGEKRASVSASFNFASGVHVSGTAAC
jgi:hypothetical protein